jgi:tetratricopeptide (TPR) repeat protein
MGSGAGARHRYEIILIGPVDAGKSTVGRLLAQRLGLPQVAVDTIRWDYYAQIGYDEDYVGALSGRHGFEGVYRYWKRFELYATERVLAEHADCVIDFGGGHSVYEDDALFGRARRALAPFHNVVLILPAPDLDESVRLLRERTGMPPAAGGRLDFVEHFVRHHSNHDLATLTVYTQGKTPEETAEDVLGRITWSPAWRLPPEARQPPHTAARATTLLHAAVHVSGQYGDHDAAARYLDEALAIRRELGSDAAELAEALRAQATVDEARGRLDGARQHLIEALALYEAEPLGALPALIQDDSPPPATPPVKVSPTGYAQTLSSLAHTEHAAGNWIAAREWSERAAAAWQPFGRGRVARALQMLAEAAREQGDFARAERAYDEALAISRAQAAVREIAATQCIGGHLALARGDLSAARARYVESFAIRRERGDQAARCEILEGLALLAAAEGQAQTALTLAGAAAALQKNGPSPAAPMRALRERYLDPARQALAPEAQLLALHTGEAMSPEEALAYAAFVGSR